MSQQYPPQQPYGYAAPPPPPPKKNSTGKIIGIGCGGIVGLIVVISIIGALVSSGDDSKSDTASTATSSAPAAQKTDPAPDKTSEAPAAEEPKEDAPVAVTAKKTAFAKSILADSSKYTSVLVTITNNSDKPISVNPLWFTITDTAGTKHTAEIGVDEKQIDTVELAPGENISGTITGKGAFTAKYVTYVDGFIGDPVRADLP
jgi:cytoskeletal protein RodZ